MPPPCSRPSASNARSPSSPGSSTRTSYPCWRRAYCGRTSVLHDAARRGGEPPRTARPRRRAAVSDAVSVLKDIGRALAYAHARGVVHRDIKPGNVLLSGGAAVVTDFGVAKAMDASATSGGTTSLTQLGVALGTPAYMAPEQAAADPDVDHRADLYAFGCLAYELLTGSPPFAGRPAPALLAAQVNEVPEPIGRRRPIVPSALAALVMRCLEKRPADRPASAEEVLRALDVAGIPTAVAGDVTVRPAGISKTERRVGAVGSFPRPPCCSAPGSRPCSRGSPGAGTPPGERTIPPCVSHWRSMPTSRCGTSAARRTRSPQTVTSSSTRPSRTGCRCFAYATAMRSSPAPLTARGRPAVLLCPRTGAGSPSRVAPAS